MSVNSYHCAYFCFISTDHSSTAACKNRSIEFIESSYKCSFDTLYIDAASIDAKAAPYPEPEVRATEVPHFARVGGCEGFSCHGVSRWFSIHIRCKIGHRLKGYINGSFYNFTQLKEGVTIECSDKWEILFRRLEGPTLPRVEVSPISYFFCG